MADLALLVLLCVCVFFLWSQAHGSRRIARLFAQKKVALAAPLELSTEDFFDQAMAVIDGALFPSPCCLEALFWRTDSPGQECSCGRKWVLRRAEDCWVLKEVADDEAR